MIDKAQCWAYFINHIASKDTIPNNECCFFRSRHHLIDKVGVYWTKLMITVNSLERYEYSQYEDDNVRAS